MPHPHVYRPLALLMATPLWAATSDQAAQPVVFNSELRAEILAMAEVDQAARST